MRHGQWRVLEGDETRENFLCLLGNSAQNSVSCVTSFGVIFRRFWRVQDSELSGCKCPPGFKGDGFHCQGMYSLLTLLRFPANLRQNCVELSEPGLPLLIPVGIADVDECRDKLACSVLLPALLVQEHVGWFRLQVQPRHDLHQE